MMQIVFVLVAFVVALSAGASVGNQGSILHEHIDIADKLENIVALGLIHGLVRKSQSTNLLGPVLPKIPDPFEVANTYITFPGGDLAGYITHCNSVLTGTSTIKDDLSFSFGIPADVKFVVDIDYLHLEGQHDVELFVKGDVLKVTSFGDYTVDLKGTKINLLFEVLLIADGAFAIKSASIDFSFDSLAINATNTIANCEPLDWEAFNEGIKDLFDQLWPKMKPSLEAKVFALAKDLFSECNVNTMLDGDLSCIRKSGKSSIGDKLSEELKNYGSIKEAKCPPQPPPPPHDGSYIIQSDNATNEGKWASGFDRCPEGTFANGFQVKTEKFQSPFADDTAMNGLRLFCSNSEVSITSLEGGWGDWGKTYKCPNDETVKGFQLRVESSGQTDDTATNNIRILCAGGSSIEGDGLKFGSWRNIFTCRDNFAACGLRTQIEPDQSPIKDDTALNNIAMLCCPIST